MKAAAGPLRFPPLSQHTIRTGKDRVEQWDVEALKRNEGEGKETHEIKGQVIDLAIFGSLTSRPPILEHIPTKTDARGPFDSPYSRSNVPA